MSFVTISLYLDDKIVSYCCDTAICQNDYLLAKDCDLLIHECALATRSEVDKWGHSTPEEAAGLAKKARAKKAALTHFGPNSYNDIGKRKWAEKTARKIFPNTIAAVDELIIEI